MQAACHIKINVCGCFTAVASHSLSKIVRHLIRELVIRILKLELVHPQSWSLGTARALSGSSSVGMGGFSCL